MQSVEVHKAINAADVADQASHVFIDEVIELQAKQKLVHVALTGGTVGILTLKHLHKHPRLNEIDLTRLHIWFGDERYVASDSSDRNSQQAREALLSHLEIPAINIHEFPSTDSGLAVRDAAIEFERTLLEWFDDEPQMDLMLLGMGPDGHVASLFPGHHYSDALIVSESNSPKPPSERLSMSMQMLNASKRIVFVVSGMDKAQAIEQIHKNDECDLPASKVSAQGQTLWIIDEAAGASFWSC
jgi:6-phosphogluconolactonase